MTVLLVIFEVGFGLDRDFYHDERHFLPAIRYFAGEVTLEKLREYDEANSPLPFIVYAKFGDLFGFELWKMRMLSVLIGVLTAAAYYALFRRLLGSDRVAWFGMAVLLLNPYFIRCSIFVFTDMMPVLFMALFLLLASRRRSVLPLLLIAGMLLCRQYYLFVLVGAAGLYVARAALVEEDRGRSAVKAISIVLCLVPFGLLALMWGGVLPPNARFRMVPAGYFRPEAMTAYVLMAPVYVLPVVLVRLKVIYGSVRVGIAACVLSSWYLLFPAKVTYIHPKMPAMGTFHRLVQIVSGGHAMLEQGLLFAFFLLGLPVTFYIVTDAWRRLRRRQTDFALLLDLTILAFLLVMVFTCVVWEKYLLPLMPLLILRLLLIGRPDQEAQPLP